MRICEVQIGRENRVVILERAPVLWSCVDAMFVVSRTVSRGFLLNVHSNLCVLISVLNSLVDSIPLMWYGTVFHRVGPVYAKSFSHSLSLVGAIYSMSVHAALVFLSWISLTSISKFWQSGGPFPCLNLWTWVVIC